MTGTEIVIRTANALEKATKKIDNEASRESRRQAEGVKVPTPTPGIPASPPLEEILELPNNRAVNRGEGTSALRDL